MEVYLNHILKEQKFQFFYQPIYDLNTWHIFAFESLLRVPDQPKLHIEELFSNARLNQTLYKVDTAAIEGAVETFPFTLFTEQQLFINLFPSTLLDPRFEYFLYQLMMKHPEAQGNIVFELNESAKEQASWAAPELANKIQWLNQSGIPIAIDDVGAGSATLKQIIEYKPKYIKLDRYFAKNLASSKEKQQIVQLLTNYNVECTTLILEGIEDEKDLATACALNVPFAQGYLLGKPRPILQYKTQYQFHNSIYTYL
ncbi:EAL domain-containing protein [Priestia megaterium]|uniref:EAL domain-containing protein n=1 Tax=Priestia megaterium TaxID=1404 RepID=UPI003458D842